MGWIALAEFDFYSFRLDSSKSVYLGLCLGFQVASGSLGLIQVPSCWRNFKNVFAHVSGLRTKILSWTVQTRTIRTQSLFKVYLHSNINVCCIDLGMKKVHMHML